jgi:hypothetical protein
VQLEESLAYYRVLVISPPSYPKVAGSYLDLLPRPVYHYSITLEAGLL